MGVDKLKDWWDEDTKRVNAMAETARRLGVVADTKEGPPPALNPDGSLKDEGWKPVDGKDSKE